MKTDGRHVLLTGASGGIGRELLRRLRPRAGIVSVIGRHKPTAAIENFIEADLSSREGIEKAATGAENLRPDIFISLAGTQYFGPAEDEPEDAFYRASCINYLAPLRLSQAVLKPMKSRGQGQIVLIGSVMGAINFGYYATYSAAKSGQHGFAEALRRELSVHPGIQVSYIAPRGVKTAFNGRLANRFADMAKMTLDDPSAVADRILHCLEAGAAVRHFGFPERFFARFNEIFPLVVDKALQKPMRQAACLFSPQEKEER